MNYLQGVQIKEIKEIKEMNKYVFLFFAVFAMGLLIACSDGKNSVTTDIKENKKSNISQVVEHQIVLSGGESENETISVKQGEDIKLIFSSDVEMEVHLHGYDIKLIVGHKEESIMEFTANATGRFAITSHQGLESQHDHKSHTEHAALFESETLLKGDTFIFEIADELNESTIAYHDHMSHGDSGTINVSSKHKENEVVEIKISDSGFHPAEIMVGPGTKVKWISEKESKVRVTSGVIPEGSHDSHGHAKGSHGESNDKHGEKGSHEEKTLLIVEVRP